MPHTKVKVNELPASGYNPLEGIPKENMIVVDTSDPESTKRAAEKIAEIIKNPPER